MKSQNNTINTHHNNPLQDQHSTRNDIEIALLVAFAHGVSHFFQFLLPALFPWFVKDFGLTYFQVGLLTTAFFMTSACCQAPFGAVVDRFGPHRILNFGLACLGLVALGLYFTGAYWQLVVLSFVAGVGNSVFHPADFALLNQKVSEKNLVFAFSAHGLAGNIGWIVAPIVLTLLSSAFGWRVAALLTGLLIFVLVLILFFRRQILDHKSNTSNDTYHNESTDATQPSTNFLQVLKSLPILKSFLFFVIVSFAFGGYQNFLVPYFMEFKNFSKLISAQFLSQFLLGSIFGVIISGFLVKKAQRVDLMLAGVLSVAGVASLVVTFIPANTLALSALLILAGFGMGLAGPARDLLIRNTARANFGDQAMGRVYGVAYSGLDIGLALAPFCLGLLMDSSFNYWLFVVIGSFFILGGFISTWVQESQ